MASNFKNKKRNSVQYGSSFHEEESMIISISDLSSVIEQEDAQSVIKVANKPRIVFVEDDDQESEDIFGSEIASSKRSSLFNSKSSVSNQSDIVIRKKSIRVPQMKMESGMNINASISDDGKASWTLQKQREAYKEV